MSQENLKRGKGVFKVFVSSTFRDLENEREEKGKIIDGITLESIGMESFVPSEKTSHETSLDNIRKSDIYLLLIGKRYGSDIKEECKIKCGLKNSGCDGKISYTHCEYRTAINNNLPLICFELLPEEKDKELPEESGDLKKKLENFKKEVGDTVYLKQIKKDSLKDEVKNALKKDIKRWICEGKLNLPEFYGRTNELNELLDSNASTIFVKGIGGIGKTTLIEAFLLVKKIGGSEILEVVKERDYNRTDVGYWLARCALERKEYKALDLRSLAEILGIPVQLDDETIIKNIISALNNRNLILFIDDAHEIKDEQVFDLISRCTSSLTGGKIILAGRKTLKTNIGKTVPVEKGIKNHEFIKSVFKENGIEKEWNTGISDKIMNITSGHPLAVKLVAGNLDHITPDSFTNILINPYDENIERIAKGILGDDFEKIASLSVHRIPFSLEPNLAEELTWKMIVKKTNGEFVFTYDSIQEVLYASIKDKKQAHKEASEYYKNFEGSSNYKEIAEYLYHLAKSGDKEAYSKYRKYKDILNKQGFYRELISINEVLLKGFRDIGDRVGESRCHIDLGDAYYSLGDFRGAISHFNKLISTLEYISTGKIPAEEYYTSKLIDRADEVEVKYQFIEDTKKEWIRVCLVQLDFSVASLSNEFGYILQEEDCIKKKVFDALKIASENKVDIICFPELSIVEDWIEKAKKQYQNMIIVFGTYYLDSYNTCPIIVDGQDYYIQKINPSPHFEGEVRSGKYMKKGKRILVFQTKYCKFAVLICIDYLREAYRILHHQDEKINGVDFIIVPEYNKDTKIFQEQGNVDCQGQDGNYPYILQNNALNVLDEKAGKTCVIGMEHKSALKRYITEGLKPKDDIEYKLIETKEENLTIIDLDIKRKGVSVTEKTHKIKLVGEYIFRDGAWEKC